MQAISAARAIDMLEDPATELIDIRTPAEIKESGNPDLRSIKRTIIAIPYTPVSEPTDGGTVVLGWADKLNRSKKVRHLATWAPLASNRYCFHV